MHPLRYLGDTHVVATALPIPTPAYLRRAVVRVEEKKASVGGELGVRAAYRPILPLRWFAG